MCFVCYGNADIEVDVKTGNFIITIRLCKDCFRILITEAKILAMCIICGSFRIVDPINLSQSTGRIKMPEKNKVNVAFIDDCPCCKGNLDNITGHA